jgi:hypothetical protein
MKRKPNPQKADRENPAWTKETFARARRARISISIRLPPETLARWKAKKEDLGMTPKGRRSQVSRNPALPFDSRVQTPSGPW